VWWVLGATLVAAALASLSWPMTVDEPLLAYVALAIDRFGLIPYRDIVDFNTPGAHLANMAIGRAFGYSELGFRIADLTLLGALMTCTAMGMKPFGWRVSATAALLFGFTYLGLGPVMSLQREYFVVVTVSAAIAVVLSTQSPDVRAGVIGWLFGMAATIKPQSAMVLPVFVAWLCWTAAATRAAGLRMVAIAAAGFAVPIGAVAGWLWSIGAMPAFVDMASNYWPLYNQLTGIHPSRIVAGADRWWWNAQRFILSRDLRHLMLVPAVIGCAFVLTRSAVDEARRREVWLLISIAVVLQVYPLAAGKFWEHHWLPSLYASCLLAALCFAPDAERSSFRRDTVPAMTAVMLTALSPGLLWLARDAGRIDMPRSTTATQIAAELRGRLRPGDRVQPLEWAAGAVHALFLTHTPVATPFIYDFHFYHHVSSPYIQRLRARLLRDLDAARPAFVVDSDLGRGFEGPDTTAQFVELSDWLRQHYRAIAANDRFVIYERKDREPVEHAPAARSQNSVIR
jgi:hypothetical protein